MLVSSFNLSQSFNYTQQKTVQIRDKFFLYMDPGVYFELTPAAPLAYRGQQRIIYVSVLRIVSVFSNVYFYFMFAAGPPTVHRRQIAGS